MWHHHGSGMPTSPGSILLHRSLLGCIEIWITLYQLKCLNQCFARLQSWKSVSSKTAVDPSSRFCEFETLFQHRCRTKHWLKNLKILAIVINGRTIMRNSLKIPKQFHSPYTMYKTDFCSYSKAFYFCSPSKSAHPSSSCPPYYWPKDLILHRALP